MARRRRPNSPPPKHFVCDDAINRMERAVIYRTVDLTSFTGHDIVDLVVPAEHARLLRDAFPHTQSNHGIWDVHLPVGGDNFHIQMHTAPFKILVPHDISPGAWKITNLQPSAKQNECLLAFTDIVRVVNEHNVLRRVVNWFNENNVPPGFARHYFPSLGALLDPAHVFHQMDGLRYADRHIPYEIVNDLRKAPEIIAKGLFCRPDEHSTLEGRPVCSCNVGEGPQIPLFTAT